MTLQEIRERFIEMSGRTDLGFANTQGYSSSFSIYSDVQSQVSEQKAGADYYINRAQTFLDNAFEQEEHKACITIALERGENMFVFPNEMKYVTQVLWEETLLKMHSFDLRFLRVPSGKPNIWCFAPMRDLFNKKETQERMASKGIWFNKDHLVRADRCQTIMILPIPDVAGQLSVMGFSYTKELKQETDTSVWTVKYPEILLTAALMLLEKAYRNTEGYKDYKTAVTDMILSAQSAQIMQEQSFLGEMYERF